MEISMDTCDDLPLFSASFDAFRHGEQVDELIEKVKSLNEAVSPSESSSGGIAGREEEVLHEKFIAIMDMYQEQPHLLDPHLNSMMDKLLAIVETALKEQELAQSQASSSKLHMSFKFLYQLTKVRGFKVMVRRLPHQVSDLEQTLILLENQKPEDNANWQTRYMLLLWLSVAIQVPFSLSVIKVPGSDLPASSRVYRIIQTYLVVGDKSRDAAAFLASKFLTRPDVKEFLTDDFITWISEILESDENEKTAMGLIAARLGILSSLAYIFKFGKREDLESLAPRALKLIPHFQKCSQGAELVRKMVIKLVQRIGLSFLQTRVAHWRYKRGTRSLLDNMKKGSKDQVSKNSDQGEGEIFEMDALEDAEVPPELEDVIQMLLEGLRDSHTIVRWSASKGLGRITNRLPKEYAMQVVSSVVEIFSFRESDSAWHGACLAVAELAKWGLILPDQLPDVMPAVTKALIYDENKGSFSVGAHVRDAACYVLWAFARAYDPKVLAPFASQIGPELVNVALFDREVNCRRAAAASFQENVGRHGLIAHGIPLVTTLDYQAVGSRVSCYVEIAPKVATYPEYSIPLIEHLLSKKVAHWDPTIRELASQSLEALCAIVNPGFFNSVLKRLITQNLSMDLVTRHGSILALARIIHGLSALKVESLGLEDSIYREILNHVRNIVFTLNDRKLLHGFGGELMKKAICVLIECVSKSGLNYHTDAELLDSWSHILLEVIQNPDALTRSYGVNAFPIFCEQYLKPSKMRQDNIISNLQECLQKSGESARCGALSCMGSLPLFMLDDDMLPAVTGTLVNYVYKVKPGEESYAESRAAAISSLISIWTRVPQLLLFGYSNNLRDIYRLCFKSALSDYTQDKRGDIGVLVRRAAVENLLILTKLLLKNGLTTVFEDDIVREMMDLVLIQAVSHMDKMRDVAGYTFHQLIHLNIPNVPHHQELQNIFVFDGEDFDWKKESGTFPIFVKLFHLEMFRSSLWKGLFVSVGGLTESVVRDSRDAITRELQSMKSEKPNELEQICRELVKQFQENIQNERLCLPMLHTLDHLLQTGLLDTTSDEIKVTLLKTTWESSKTSSDPKKIIGAMGAICGFLQFSVTHRSALGNLSILLCHRFPRVRTTTADYLYTALMINSELIFGENVEKQDEVLAKLSETDWTNKLDVLRPVRDSICEACGIKAPVVKSKAT